MPAEPTWGKYPSRVAVVQACSAWHQSLRGLVPDEARRKGIEAGWPKWNEQAGWWKVCLLREADRTMLVTAIVWPDGRWRVMLYNDLGEVTKKLERTERVEGDTLFGMESAFLEIIEKTSKEVAQHPTEAMGCLASSSGSSSSSWPTATSGACPPT